MNFTHLAAFQAVVETGSVTAAAERLHVSQPALTREIRQLEERLGLVLFDRLPRGMQPTEAGRLLAGYASQIFRLADAAETALTELGGLVRGRLAVAASRTTGAYLLPPIVAAYRQRHPGVELSLSVSNTEQVQARLLAFEAQLGLVEGPTDAAAFERLALGEDEVVAVAATGHALAGRGPLDAAALDAAELVMREPGSGTRSVVEQAYAARGLVLRPRLTLGSPEAIKQLLRLGGAVSWVSRRSVADELAAGLLVELPLPGLQIRRELAMIWRRGQGLSPSAQAFRALAAPAGPMLEA
ncbi:LysR family transcriptional regulator [Roseateles saccharophilus]|uniref:LysR family transcriptional regulator n=1 Tax=Roseateles saccharophilus TaxID=304 RepID=A0A4V2VR86_ROSSA|nr:LysR family transcriptional regulator [Roseateles saccharophilus]MDG0831925.1 LysR family transcriptional regulator [Roseateles saccharophilus]TCU97409.1 LysR family transcriptional regulator [Roseateles saccharophilus]